MDMAPDKPEETNKVEKISAWIDGDMTAEASIQFAEALGKDPLLRLEAQETKAAWDLLDHLPKPENSPTLTNKTLALLQLRDIQPATSEVDATRSKLTKSYSVQMVGWWMVLGLVFGISFGLSWALMKADNRSRLGIAKYLWLNAASVPVEYRQDTEFLKWIVAPERFGTPKP